MLGMYYRDLAESQDSQDKQAIQACYHQSAAAYKNAALLYPKDDEFHLCELSNIDELLTIDLG